MAVLACDVCGGKLVMGTGGVAVCDSCGMEHSKDRMQEKVQEIKGTVQVSNIAGIESLMKRGHLALEDGKWGEASKYFDKVLDIDPECAPAYVGKLCAIISLRGMNNWGKDDFFVYRIKKEEDLARYYKPLDALPDDLKAYYQKAIRFADETYKAQLEGYNNDIKKRIEKLKKEFEFYMVIEETHGFCESKRDGAFGLDRWVQTGRYIREITSSECQVGQLKYGVKFKILRTGTYYEVGSYETDWGRYYQGVLEPEGGSILEGDVAVFTHEMRRLEEEKKEQARIEQQRRKEQERIEKQRREEEEQRRKEEEQRREEQQRKWASEGLCRYCGGKLGGVFTKKCKSCGKEN